MKPIDLSRPQTADQIPMLAAMATKQAYERALAAGQSVLIADNGALVEISPDGSRRVIRQIAPNIPVKAGQVISLQ